MKILAIHAHPDDVEFLCAGTLYLLSEKGHEIHIASLSSGDKGSPDKCCEEVIGIRRAEAERSASIIGARYCCLNFADFEIYDDSPSRKRVTEFLREIRPEVILTASPGDYLTDHENTSALVRNAAFFAPVRNYATGPSAPLDAIPAVYYVDPLEGIDVLGQKVKPDFCVDITSAMPIKEKMLSCHESQREWLRKHHCVDQYVESMREWSAIRGREFGCQYGEGFRQHKGHAYPQENILAKLVSLSILCN
ncbi:MAG: PIG-L family deacetylase [Candidatus Omnitrophota bacterium]|jgi:LmbE family N-acetylglucosaminyl deacetylase|nr:MAG: PIG-L family deacetylase [Candidatus Omnitrophota bacterium]